jgi:hypothetical protein
LELFKPRGAASPRRPTDNNQNNGQIVNTPRYAPMGGLSSANKVSKNSMALEKQMKGRKVI